MLYGIVDKYVGQLEDDWDERHEGNIAVSEIGGCPRAAVYRWAGVERSNPPDRFLERLFYSGKMAERKLEVPLRAEFGEALRHEPTIKEGRWLGTPDFVVDGLYVFEHKEKSGNGFRGEQLPKRSHVLQLAMYQHMLGQDYEAWLYYQNQGHRAQFRVWEWEDAILWEGEIGDAKTRGELDTTIDSEKVKIERAIDAFELEGLPPARYETPLEIDGHCCSLYKTVAYQRCQWFDRCWRDTKYQGGRKFRI
jgi:hypothetical protein